MAWTIDKVHSEVTFAVRHMMVSTVRGSFADFDATLELDAQHPERSRVTATIDVASVTTGQADRDADLRSANFFDAARYPQITFVSHEVVAEGDDRFRLRGDLTIRGVTRELELQGEFSGPVPHILGGEVVGFSLQGEIDRDLFGLDHNMPLPTGGVVIGKMVKIGIEAEAVRAAAAAEQATVDAAASATI